MAEEPATTPPLAGPAVEEAGPLPRAELRGRASAGVAITAARGVIILVVSVIGNVVVARLLTPRDFGVVALGLSLVSFVSLVADGGLGGGLIRRAEPPHKEELQALNAFQAGIAACVAVVVSIVATWLGKSALVIALMVWSMPVAMLQLPGRILLERDLRYRPLAVVEIVQIVVFNAWAITFVALGFGVWGLASATVAMRFAALAVMRLVCPAGVVRPRFAWKRVRPLLSFGIRYQAVSATLLVEQEGLNGSIAALAGVSTLGLWSLAGRVMEAPFLLFESLWRVSFPAMSHLVAAKTDVTSVLERLATRVAIGGAVLLTPLAAASQGVIPGVFGERWRDVGAVIPLLCLALAVSGPISVASQGYLYAVGDAGAVLRAQLSRTVALFAVALPLLPAFGLPALALAAVVAAVVDACVLVRSVRKWSTTRLVRVTAVPSAIAVLASAVGWLLSEQMGADLRSGIVGGVCATAILVVGLGVLCAGPLRDSIGFALDAVRRATGRGATPAAAV